MAFLPTKVRTFRGPPVVVERDMNLWLASSVRPEVVGQSQSHTVNYRGEPDLIVTVSYRIS